MAQRPTDYQAPSKTESSSCPNCCAFWPNAEIRTGATGSGLARCRTSQGCSNASCRLLAQSSKDSAPMRTSNFFDVWRFRSQCFRYVCKRQLLITLAHALISMSPFSVCCDFSLPLLVVVLLSYLFVHIFVIRPTAVVHSSYCC